MNKEKLQILLERYYKGESTGDEDKSLREYFQGDNIPEEFEAEREIFRYFSARKDIPEPGPGFEYRILERIELADRRKRFRRYLIPALSVAASIVLIAGSYFIFRQNLKSEDTYKDPEIAYQEALRILKDVSDKMNRATLALEPVGKFEEATAKSFSRISISTGKINKSFRSLDRLSAINIENKKP